MQKVGLRFAITKKNIKISVSGEKIVTPISLVTELPSQTGCRLNRRSLRIPCFSFNDKSKDKGVVKEFVFEGVG